MRVAEHILQVEEVQEELNVDEDIVGVFEVELIVLVLRQRLQQLYLNAICLLVL